VWALGFSVTYRVNDLLNAAGVLKVQQLGQVALAEVLVGHLAAGCNLVPGLCRTKGSELFVTCGRSNTGAGIKQEATATDRIVMPSMSRKNVYDCAGAAWLERKTLLKAPSIRCYKGVNVHGKG